MTFEEYAEYDGLGLAELVAKGEVSSPELVEAAIERIERHDGKLNAVVYKAYDEAREAAKTKRTGPFGGVPFLIKDLGLTVEGWPRTSGSRFSSPEPDTRDSETVRRYRASGVVLVGKTNTPEFGIPGVTTSAKLGPCRNPWNPDHVAGGSSGGAASAVAAGMVPLAHASDGLGSIRIPAACCGLVGMKTTRDRNPNEDDADRVIGFSVDHVVSRTVRDSAAMLDATGYPEPACPYPAPPKERPYLEEVERSPGRLRIFWSGETPTGKPIDEEVQARLEDTVATLKALGHEVVERSLGVDWRTVYRAQAFVSASNFAATMRRRSEELGREPGPDDIEPLARRAYMAGRAFTGDQAMGGLQQLRLSNRQILATFEECDVYLSPVMGTPPPRVDFLDTLNEDVREFDRRQARTFPFTPPFNFTGQPSLSLPLHMSQSGLPIGMMFTGRYADEGTLYRLAGQLEKEMPWKDRHPPIWG